MLIRRIPIEQAAWHNLDFCDWPEEFPYKPDVKFRMCHCGDALTIDFSVSEDCCAATTDKDNGEVWNDSCVEFFFRMPGDAGYYNIETNCIGTVLMAHRLGKDKEVKMAPPQVLSTILRKPSLGREPFAEKKTPTQWSLRLVIPASAFFMHEVKDFSQLEATCNVYKCGDLLSMPHFLSWEPVETPAPDFHRPEFFGNVKFE